MGVVRGFLLWELYKRFYLNFGRIIEIMCLVGERGEVLERGRLVSLF